MSAFNNNNDLPPQLGDIPHTSALHVPTLSSSLDQTTGPAITTTTNTTDSLGATAGYEHGSTTHAFTGNTTSGANGSAINAENAKATLVNAKDTAVTSAQQAMDTISNHPITQNAMEHVNNAPITQVAKDQTAKTSAEFDNLKASRKTPDATLSNDQPLTHYHSFFYTLLSWENPRATGIAFAITLLGIFAFRYVPALRWIFKSLYLVLGSVALVEGVTKLVFGAGVAQSMRPKRYLTIPREALESSLEDVEQLINFFVIEFQRILYAENVIHTTLAFAVSFISYYLIKFVPTWGLMLIGDTLLFSVPLIYITNKEAIDHYLNSASEVASAQAEQVRQLASEQTSKATTTLKAYAGDASAKAQELAGSAKAYAGDASVKAQDMAGSANAKAQDMAGSAKAYAGDASAKAQNMTGSTKGRVPSTNVGASNFKSEDFPRAPAQDPIVGEVAASREPVLPAY